GGCESPLAPPGHGHGGRDPLSAGAVRRLERGRGRRPGGEGRAGWGAGKAGIGSAVGGRRLMTRSVSTAPAAIAPTPALCVSTRSQAVVRLGDLDVAPENLRHGEAPDDDISQLADTIAAAGLLQLPTVRPG